MQIQIPHYASAWQTGMLVPMLKISAMVMEEPACGASFATGGVSTQTIDRYLHKLNCWSASPKHANWRRAIFRVRWFLFKHVSQVSGDHVFNQKAPRMMNHHQVLVLYTILLSCTAKMHGPAKKKSGWGLIGCILPKWPYRTGCPSPSWGFPPALNTELAKVGQSSVNRFRCRPQWSR